ncbi:SUR7/PalI family-domain-containing protein [Butyriboletus roseoflavus]|nr:SUR7/PalI family-domain-containing protein [Butyriboletus roseoflavus]
MPGGQLYPLETNPQTGEPFLRLPAPNDNIILTAPRMSDAKSLAPIINDPRVSVWLEGPPIPYRDEYAEEWLAHIVKQSEDVLGELREEDRAEGPLKVVGGCPVRHLREVLLDGTDIYIGDIGINRAQMEEVLDPDERKRAVEANNGKAIGDPSIVWTFGDYLAPSHHGRGIMSAAMGAILNGWAIPRMGVRRMVGYTFTGNEGSRRVFEKNGFEWKRTVDNGKLVRGERKTLNYLHWELAQPPHTSNMSSLIRPATPGFVITLAATVILAVVSFSVPLIKSVYFLKASLAADNLNGDITFGTLGYCMTIGSSTTCSNATVGYQLDVNALVGNTTAIQIPQVVVKWLTYVLVLHIAAFGLAAIAALFGLLAHVREMAMTCFSSCISGFAAFVALVAFVFDLAIFFVAKSRMNSVSGGSASIGNAVWLTLVAWILLFFSGCFYGIGRCCISRRSRDTWGAKAGTPIGENGYNANEQMRLDAVKAEADRKARQAQPEVGLPAFNEYDQSQPLKARVDGDEVYLEEDVPYRDNQSVSTSGKAGMGTYGRTTRGGYAGSGYMQAPPGTRAVDEYNNASPYPQRRSSNTTHTTTTTTPSVYPPSSGTPAPIPAPVAAMYDSSPGNHYNQDPYSPQAYGHIPGGTSRDPYVEQSHVPYDPYGAFSPDTYNTTAAIVDNPSQSPYGIPYNTRRTPTQPDRGYMPGGGAYGATTVPAPQINDPYSDPYYGHYQAPPNPTPPPVSQSPLMIDTQVVGAPTSVSPVRGPRGPRNSITMAPPPVSSAQYTDSPPTYESGQSGAPGQWGNKR